MALIAGTGSRLAQSIRTGFRLAQRTRTGFKLAQSVRRNFNSLIFFFFSSLAAGF